MKTIIKIGLAIMLFLAAATAGFFYAGHRTGGMSGMDDEMSMDSTSGEGEVLYWVAPMDANFRRDAPGKSPMGMDLIPVYANATGSMNKDEVTVSAAVQQSLGVRTALAKVAPLTQRLNTVGMVSWDQNTLSMLHPRVEGWLERFHIASAGDRVKRGEVLYEVYSPKLVSAQREYLTARASGNRGLSNASRERLLALGVTAAQVREIERRGAVIERLPFLAERDAIAAEIAVRPGSYVTPMSNIATLADLDTVWIDVEVFESDAGWMQPGLQAKASFSAFPGESWDGEVAYVYPQLNAMTRTLRLRLKFANPDGRLKPNMYARVELADQAAAAMALQIDRDAVIQSGLGERVIVALGEGRFRVQPVKTGRRSGAQVAITDGLKAGDVVVISGQFLIDSEANGEQALARLAALREASGMATITGFPRRGKIRLEHDPMPALQWSAMNMVFDVASGINLMPFNKQDRVQFSIAEQTDGSWLLTDIAKSDDSPIDMPMDRGMGEMNHQGMQHGAMHGDIKTGDVQ